MPGPTFEARWVAVMAGCRADSDPLFAVPEDAFSRLATDVVTPLGAKLADPDRLTMLVAGIALAQLTRHADAIVPIVIPQLGDPDPIRAEHARWVIHELGDAAVPALIDAYASAPSVAIAEALALFGPRAARAADVIREDARTQEPIAKALWQIEGPWEEAPAEPLPYLGESVRLDGGGPSEPAAYGFELWLGEISRALDDWYEPDDGFATWRPDHVALAAPELVVTAYNHERAGVVTATIDAPDGSRFTNQELLWAILDVHHRIAPCNDRIFEGLKRQDDGSYHIFTGS